MDGELFSKQCNLCDYHGPTRSFLIVHQYKAHGIGRRSCELCYYHTTSKKAFKKHIFEEHEDGKYKCDKCDYTVTNFSGLVSHARAKHHIKCNHCEYSTTRISNLTKHVIVAHEKGDKVEIHMESVHKDEVAKYFCYQCEFKAANSKDLDVHIETNHEVHFICI